MHRFLILITFLMNWVGINGQSQFSLDEAIEYGIEHQNEILIKQKEISEADADIRQYKSIGMPKLNGTVNYQYYFFTPVQPTPDFLTPAVYDVLFDENVLERRELGPPDVFELGFVQPHNLSAGLEASMLVFDGSYLVGLRAAKLYKDLVRRQLNATEQEVRGKIAKAYIAVLIADENLGIINKNITTITTSLNEMKKIYEEGFAESLDVDRLTLSYNNLNIEKEKIEGLIQLSKNLLKFQMNFPIDNKIELTDEIDDLVDMELALQNYNEINYDNRAEFAVLNTGRALNELDVERNKKAYLPSIRLFANLQGSLLRRNLFDGEESGILPTGLAGIGISLPLYDGGDKSARIQKAKISIEKTDIQIASFKNAVQLQVNNARISLINAQKSLVNTQKALAINENIYDKTQIKFREGVGSSVEITQAENSLYQAQGAYINALYDLLSAQTEWYIALGII
jgi:outer membrane protein TolC